MSWFKIDDGFWSHPKTTDLSGGAVALWVRAGSYCCQHLTDGTVSRGSLRFLGSADDAAELVDSGLWVSVEDGYRFHDWDEYQETSEVVKRRRDMARERQRKARAAREQKRHENLMSDMELPSESRDESHSESRRDIAESSQEVFNPRPGPSRPDLLLPTEVEKPLSNSYPQDFLDWYRHYPRHASKREAAKAFARAKTRTDTNTLIEAAKRYAADPNREAKYTKLPASWLNADCWEDSPLPANTTHRDPTRAEWDGLKTDTTAQIGM